jgi:hypothetical protein
MCHSTACPCHRISAKKAAGQSAMDRTMTTEEVGSFSSPGQDLTTSVITDTKKAIAPMAINAYDMYCIIPLISISFSFP